MKWYKIYLKIDSFINRKSIKKFQIEKKEIENNKSEIIRDAIQYVKENGIKTKFKDAIFDIVEQILEFRWIRDEYVSYKFINPNNQPGFISSLDSIYSRISEVDKKSFLKDLREYDRVILDACSPKTKYWKISNSTYANVDEFFMSWINDKELKLENNEFEDFNKHELIYKFRKCDNENQVIFIIKNIFNSVRNKIEFIYWAKLQIEKEIEICKRVLKDWRKNRKIRSYKTGNDLQYNLNAYKFEESYKKNKENLEFALKFINEVIENEDSQNSEPQIDNITVLNNKNETLTATQKLLLIRLLQDFGLFPKNKNQVTYKQFNEFIGSIINEKEETIKKKWKNIDEIMYLKLTTGQKKSRINDLKIVKEVIKKIDFIEIEKFIDTQIMKIEQI